MQIMERADLPACIEEAEGKIVFLGLHEEVFGEATNCRFWILSQHTRDWILDLFRIFRSMLRAGILRRSQ